MSDQKWWKNINPPAYHSEGGYLDQAFSEMALSYGTLDNENLTLFARSVEGPLKDEFKKTFLATFSDRIVEKGGRMLYETVWGKQADSYSRVYLVKGGICNFRFEDATFDVRFSSYDKEFVEEFCAYLKPFIGPKVSQGKAYVIVSGAEGPSLTSIGVASVKFEEGNYTKDVGEGFRHVITDLKTVSPSGRVAILDGEPGTGKTFLIRSLLKEVPDAIFIMVAAGAIEMLTSPNLVPLLIRTKRESTVPIVFVIEDADACLVPRQADNVNAISTLLNFSDGILGSLLDIRIIATTNAKIDEIDKAILRPGRLSRRIDVSRLSTEHAVEVFTRLTGNPPAAGTLTNKRGHTLAEIYSLARDNGYEPPAAGVKIGFMSGEFPDYD